MNKFTDFKISEIILQNLLDTGYETPTPIQSQAIPIVLEGHDLLGIAQTGTGKTAAFSVPIINYLVKNPMRATPMEPRVLILAPTRELASQINQNIKEYGKNLHLRTTTIFGGVGQGPQVQAIRNGLDILVATPGRLIDLMNQNLLRLNKIEIFVLDEADRMLDMGFIHDIRKVIAKLPQKRQTLFFSATMPPEIAKLAANILHNPKKVEVTPPATTVERINQKIIFCMKADKYQLVRTILEKESVALALVFTKTKHGANKVVEYLAHYKIKSAAIHGNKSQTARELALNDFKAGKIKVLVATDIAARGIDVDGITHVINYDLPMEAESYVHRIGRTARAGKDGEAISFCDETEHDLLKQIERITKQKIPTEKYTSVPEVMIKLGKKHRDPRAKPKNTNPATQAAATQPQKKVEGTGKVGFRFKNKKRF
jgi:ATP-dependent RNA helicase RhlE